MMVRKRKRTSRYHLATRARSHLSTLVSKKSSTKCDTETQQASSYSSKPASPYGSSIRRGFHRGIYTSTKTGRRETFDSSYELRRFKALDEHPLVENWGRPKMRIRYRLGKRKKNYHPDILVKYYDGRIFLEEVKGAVWQKLMFVKKNQAAKLLCKCRGWHFRIIWEKDLETLF
jgi:hypothetical protein